MIRPLRADDLDVAVSIWLAASIKTHHFISEEFWLSQQQNMRDLYLPNSESWVYEENGRILGFISYYEGSIPAIFVEPSSQSIGIGSQLLEMLKIKYKKLTLSVFAENLSAYKFYIHHGFINTRKCICEHTGHEQFEMYWLSNKK